jgi:hypothetical protein
VTRFRKQQSLKVGGSGLLGRLVHRPRHHGMAYYKARLAVIDLGNRPFRFVT